MKRRLAVILASDVAGYSALVAADEEHTVAQFTRLSATVTEIVTRHEGRVFNTAGDALLAEFNGPVAAVRCAVDIHEACRALGGEAENSTIRFRIGIAVGDIIVADNNDLLGDAVNVASRLCAMAEPGTTCISQEIERMVRNKVSLALTDTGEHQLKNIPEPVHVFRIDEGEGRRVLPRRFRRLGTMRLAALALGALLLGAGAFWFLPGRQAVSTRPFDSSGVPLVSDGNRLKIAQAYPSAKGFKALALSNEGDHYGIASDQPSEAEARKLALADCQSDSHRPCTIFAPRRRARRSSPHKCPWRMRANVTASPRRLSNCCHIMPWPSACGA
jgi:class 3 adenylate cyclase